MHARVEPAPVHARPTGGERATTLARTALDLARSLPFPWAVSVCDAALAAGLDRVELLETVERRKGLVGLPAARSAARFADPASASPAESISRVQFARHGVVAIDGPELARRVLRAIAMQGAQLAA